MVSGKPVAYHDAYALLGQLFVVQNTNLDFFSESKTVYGHSIEYGPSRMI